MKYEDKINEIMVNNKIRSTLKKAGIIPYAGPTGPTGPAGKGLEIQGSYSSINDLKIIIETQGTDYSTYKESSKKKIYKLLQIVQVVKMILDTPILSDDGNLTAESKITLKNAEQQLALRG